MVLNIYLLRQVYFSPKETFCVYLRCQLDAGDSRCIMCIKYDDKEFISAIPFAFSNSQAQVP